MARLMPMPRTRRAAVLAGTGLTAVDRIYVPNSDAPIEALGGSCGNVLVSLAALGHDVAPILSLGTDAHGDFLVDQLRQSGCRTEYVFRSSDYGSPVIVQHVDPRAGKHWFTSTCPETNRRFPRFIPIDERHLEEVRPALDSFAVFYTDRLSPAIVAAMEEAANRGALVFFEPAGRGEDALFSRALEVCSMVKLSGETAGLQIPAQDLPSSLVVVRTYGARGLTVSLEKSELSFAAVPAPRLVDSSGSGDMVTIGLLDRLLRSWERSGCWSPETIYEGIIAGQRLAAVNCAFAGARGAFLALGAAWVRQALDGALDRSSLECALSAEPYQGY
jgi:fructokinase